MEEKYRVRLLTEEDTEKVHQLDDISFLEVEQWVESESVYGILDSKDKLIGYCTYGYADTDKCFTDHELFEGDPKVLSNLYIRREYRRRGLAKQLIIESRDCWNEIIYLTSGWETLDPMYESIGFAPVSEDSYVYYYLPTR